MGPGLSGSLSGFSVLTEKLKVGFGFCPSVYKAFRHIQIQETKRTSFLSMLHIDKIWRRRDHISSIFCSQLQRLVKGMEMESTNESTINFHRSVTVCTPFFLYLYVFGSWRRWHCRFWTVLFVGHFPCQVGDMGWIAVK